MGHKEKEYIIFCDESDREGTYYSNFYGGLIVGASQYQRATKALTTAKEALNLYSEVKWDKVTERYLPKYQTLIKHFFSEVVSGNVKVRIMFRQNAHRPRGLTVEHIEMQYFMLYYQFIKHAFGLEFIEPAETGTQLRLYFDQFPDTREKGERFKGFLLALQTSPKFRSARISIAREDITEVLSHNHVLLQCLDIVLGAMSFRLNDKHKQKRPGQTRRGKRTRAKEALYKAILSEIKSIHPNFNIGVTTSLKGNPKARWEDPYLHWRFVPKLADFEVRLTKHGQRKE
jgi:hypothetical protein